jgi:glutathione S-transferase
MALTLYYLSGSPYAWRVWLALEHKRIPYGLKTMSYDAGDFKRPDFLALNPRHRVPLIVDDGFALYESAAIVEYLADKHPGAPPLFSSDLRERAVQRRMVREADQYFATALEHLVDAVLFTPPERWSDERIAAARSDIRDELARWETTIAGDYLAGPLSAVDFTLFPQIALVHRMDKRKPGAWSADWLGPKMNGWVNRMETLACGQATWPPHWKN